MTTCPNGHAATGSERFCRTCGAAMATSEPARCTNGHEVAAGQRFCRECGEPIAGGSTPTPAPASESARTTPTCANGHANEGGARFCRTCGAAVGASVDESPSRAPVLPPPPVATPTASTWTPPPPPPAGPTQPAPVPTQPQGEPQLPAAGARRSRTPLWIGLTALVVIGAVGAWFLFVRADDTSTATSAPCLAGVSWQQKASPYGDGTAVGIRDPAEVAVMFGGARIGFPNGSEFAEMGYTSYTALPPKEFDALDTAPRDGMLFHERTTAAGPGRYYYSAGGATYQIRDEAALKSFGSPPDQAVTIPVNGLDGAPRIPKSGTLLRLKGTKTVWVIDGGTRRVAENVCGGARIHQIPDDPQALEEIPVGSN